MLYLSFELPPISSCCCCCHCCFQSFTLKCQISQEWSNILRHILHEVWVMINRSSCPLSTKFHMRLCVTRRATRSAGRPSGPWVMSPRGQAECASRMYRAVLPPDGIRMPAQEAFTPLSVSLTQAEHTAQEQQQHKSTVKCVRYRMIGNGGGIDSITG